MDRLAGELACVDLRTIVRSVMLERESGVLEVSVEEGKRRLFFLNGELFLPPANPLAQQILTELRRPGGEAKAQELMGRIASVMHKWKEGFFTFDPGRAAVPPDAVGPLPTSELVLAAAVGEETDEELLARLGGENAEWQVARRRELPNLRLPAAEALLLDRLQEPARVGSLLPAKGDRRETLGRLCRLDSVGLIERPKAAPEVESLITPEVRGRFLDRVGAELAERPVTLDVQTHRARLADLLGRMGELTHYSLLGVGGTADAGEIYSAYSELARLVHPSQAARVGLSGREEALAVLFERATEAYLVLSDPERRGRYHFEVPPPTVVTPVKAEVDPEQAKELARQLFGQARDMVAREEFHYAVELLRRALQLDRRAEYYALLAEVQRKNKNWLRQAADSLREAVLLEPQNTTLRLELADLFEQIGDSQRARSTYRSILVRYPQHAEALEALKRLEKASKREAPPAAAAAAAAEAEPSKEKKGLLGIFRKKKG